MIYSSSKVPKCVESNHCIARKEIKDFIFQAFPLIIDYNIEIQRNKATCSRPHRESLGGLKLEPILLGSLYIDPSTSSLTYI